MIPARFPRELGESRDEQPLREAPGAAASDPLQRLLAILSHELRSPLNRIQSWSHVLENELARTLTQESGRGAPMEAAPLAQHALAGIRNGVREQVQMIDRLLDCSRAIQGTLALELRPTMLMPVLQNAVDAAQPLAAAKQIRIVTDYGAGDARTRIDQVALRQALMQLLSNAIKFSPAGSKVQLLVRREQQDVHITIADEGQGIRSDVLPRLFHWFERGDSQLPGLGLGLALARACCEAQGGEIIARSAGIGCGASFTIRLPEDIPD